MTEPCTCPVIDCPTEDLYDIYSLQDEVYPFLIVCPSDYPCDLPFSGPIYLACCDGSVLKRDIPEGSSRAKAVSIFQSMLAECARRGSCGSKVNDKYTLFFNDEQCCTKYCPDGSPFVYCIARARVVGFTKDMSDEIARSLACQQASLNRICLGVKDNICCVDTAMDAEITATNLSGGQFLWFMVGGTLPPGMTFNSPPSVTRKLHISGTPTVGGNYTVTVRCQSLATGAYMQRDVVLSVIEITPATLPGAEIGVPYVEAIVVIGIPPGMTPTYSISSGSLPTGLDLYPGGEIIGTPTAGIPATFTLKVSIWD